MKNLFLLISLLTVSISGYAQIESMEAYRPLFGQKILILLNNSADFPAATNWIENEDLRDNLHNSINTLARTFEDVKTEIQSLGNYDKVIYLTDSKCTVKNFKSNLFKYSIMNNTFDILFYGHGGVNSWILNQGRVKSSTLETWRNELGRPFNIRMVYTCACYASSLNDDWIKIGADVAVGSTELNFLPEPQISVFLDQFYSGVSVKNAAKNSYEISRNFAKNIPGLRGFMFETKDTFTRLESSRPLVCGNGNLRTYDRNSSRSQRSSCLNLQSIYDLDVGETKQVKIYASRFHNHTGVYLEKGNRYKFTCRRSDKWKNNGKSTNANGYNKGFVDILPLRNNTYKVMTLVGELFGDKNDGLSYLGNHFKIGTSKTFTPSKAGWLVCHANDVSTFYGDNSGLIKLKIKRLE